ncbi:hypothetical protein PND81_23920, partial [Flavonifractor plautii]|uniref:hypothetical protein n=1 Tax=Flavonifractor plautii TaxID=292800 RepID=UPI001A9BF366
VVSQLHSTRHLQTMSLCLFAKLILPDLHLRKTAWVDRDFLAEQQANPVSTHTEKTGRSG